MKKNFLKQEIRRLLSCMLSASFTSCSYAVMIDGHLAVSDALGTTGGKSPVPVTTDCTVNYSDLSYCV